MQEPLSLAPIYIVVELLFLLLFMLLLSSFPLLIGVKVGEVGERVIVLLLLLELLGVKTGEAVVRKNFELCWRGLKSTLEQFCKSVSVLLSSPLLLSNTAASASSVRFAFTQFLIFELVASAAAFALLLLE